MIAIADAGGTKIEWRLLDQQGVKQFNSEGFNLKNSTPGYLLKSLPEGILEVQPKTIYFYGAGITSEHDREVVSSCLQPSFPSSNIEVFSDIMGSARAVYGTEMGWVGILGTGSAAVYYNGEKITQRIPSLGYRLGDEGGGTSLGRAFLAKYLRGQFSDTLSDKMSKMFPHLNEVNVLEEIYQSKNDIRLFNSMVPFIADNQKEPEIYGLVEREFNNYFQAYFPGTLKDEPIRFSGSVAHSLSNILRSVAQARSISVSLIMQNPVAGLTLYHQKHG
ncbi:MAG: N-acetylglucosamine kinase [Marinoscillum sp.]